MVANGVTTFEIFGEEVAVSSASIKGCRKSNEDSIGWLAKTRMGMYDSEPYLSITTDDEMFLAVVCDGVGGMKNGDRASRMIVEGSMEWARTTDLIGLDDMCHNFKDFLSDLEKKMIEALPGSATTFVALLGTHEGWRSLHLGDSRCYAIGKDGYRFRTKDHSLVEKMFTYGLIEENRMNSHPQNNIITNYIGGNHVDCMQINNLEPWSIAILSSDGAHTAYDRKTFEELI